MRLEKRDGLGQLRHSGRSAMVTSGEKGPCCLARTSELGELETAPSGRAPKPRGHWRSPTWSAVLGDAHWWVGHQATQSHQARGSTWHGTAGLLCSSHPLSSHRTKRMNRRQPLRLPPGDAPPSVKGRSSVVDTSSPFLSVKAPVLTVWAVDRTPSKDDRRSSGSHTWRHGTRRPLRADDGNSPGCGSSPVISPGPEGDREIDSSLRCEVDLLGNI